ncbi:hypothetical protein [Aquimarina agarilytica]|uniref:hypothetical protein n=1 Tax=Aquimarina agarilytica TaxID=1087449 RepID=UPI000307B486|nr:hypothetical protein [Aquimarina agarilytica]
MEGTIINHSVTASIQNTKEESNNVVKSYKAKSDSKEFLSGVFYLFKKVFLLG